MQPDELMERLVAAMATFVAKHNAATDRPEDYVAVLDALAAVEADRTGGPVFRLRKVFDRGDMPDVVRTAMSNFAYGEGNTCDIIEMTIDHCVPDQVLPDDQTVQDWLVANGARKDPRPEWEGEKVLVQM